MIAYVLLGVALLAGIILILRWFVAADPKALLRTGKWVLLVGLSALALALVVSGRLQWFLGAAMALLPWLMQLGRAARTAKTYSRMAGTGGRGRTTDVRTRFLDMSLDHDSGELDGEVLEGPHVGHRLGDLSLADLLDLLTQCRSEDAQSAQILEAYLDRRHPQWRAHEWQAGAEERSGAEAGRGGDRGEPHGGMSREEAFDILGLRPGASEREIKAAHHRLIAELHPDRGGSNYLAAKVNQARQVLLRR